jgi:hypothetical protein
MLRPRHDDGQASVEMVALLPLLALMVAAAWQAVLVGQAAWVVGGAAREAARAQALGHDPAAAARRALPPALRAGLRVARDGDDAVRVRVGIPLVVPHGPTLGELSARARMEPQA